jgi:hypothetical protein
MGTPASGAEGAPVCRRQGMGVPRRDKTQILAFRDIVPQIRAWQRADSLLFVVTSIVVMVQLSQYARFFENVEDRCSKFEDHNATPLTACRFYQSIHSSP